VPLSRPPMPIDIIVPVYGAAAEFERCLGRLFAHTVWTAHRLVIVDDCGPDFPPAKHLEQEAAKHRVPMLILRNPVRRGFVGSVNRAMALSERDVVLLNSDTEVIPGWLGKLQQAAYSSPEIATVTPFSNDATICSLPQFLEANSLPAGYDLVCSECSRTIEGRGAAGRCGLGESTPSSSEGRRAFTALKPERLYGKEIPDCKAGQAA
jgi:hypothetical protein